ncbi:hypothetical protein ABZ570_29330 [Micromonospora sp. NPDC007271]|uniref:hypothetical protein n=1 Tax=Micromonospora sp. NPDC007271 TaxID=3154587 RepID=UPI0033EC9B1B
MNVSMPVVRARWCNITRITDLVTAALSPTDLGAWLVPDERHRRTVLAAAARGVIGVSGAAARCGVADG